MAEILKNSEPLNEGKKPSFEVKSLIAHAVFDSSRSPDENLNVLVSVTRDGPERVSPEKAEILTSLILESDSRGYFSHGKGLESVLPTIASVKIENGVVSFADSEGRFNRGGFSLRTDLLEKVLTNTVHKKQVAALMKLQSEIYSEMPAAETLDKKGGFRMLENGSYEIGSLSKGVKIPQSGKDFHEQTNAAAISFAETRAGTKETVSRKANWSSEKKCYIDVDTGSKVILKNGFHYLITPVQESFDLPNGKKMSALEIRQETARLQFADRAGRLLYYFNNFMDTVYKESSSPLLTNAALARLPSKEDASYIAINGAKLRSYSPDDIPDGLLDTIEGMQLPHGVVVKKIPTENKNVKKLAVTIPDMGQFIVSSTEHVIKVTENDTTICRFDTREKEATGNMKRFVKFSEALNVAMNTEWIDQKNSTRRDEWHDKNVYDIKLGE